MQYICVYHGEYPVGTINSGCPKCNLGMPPAKLPTVSDPSLFALQIIQGELKSLNLKMDELLNLLKSKTP